MKKPADFVKEYAGKAIDTDGGYGVQCVDGFRVFCQWAYGISWPTGTGYADGYWYSRNQHLELFTPVSIKDVIDGDWVIWPLYCTSHPSSHIAMYYHGQEFGQNQGGNRGFCLKSTSFTDALGALRPLCFHQKEEVKEIKAVPYAVYRLYNKNSGHHLFTASAKEANTVQKAGWKYEGIAWYHDDRGTPVKRVYNPHTGEHFYTLDQKEYKQLLASGWWDERTAFGSGRGMPVYRLYNGKTHMYTTSKKEESALRKQGWKAEKTAFYTKA